MLCLLGGFKGCVGACGIFKGGMGVVFWRASLTCHKYIVCVKGGAGNVYPAIEKLSVIQRDTYTGLVLRI